MPILDVNSIAAYIFGLVLIYTFAWIFIKPLKWLFRFLISSLFGGVLLYILNLAGGFLGLSIGINPITAGTVGLLGVPGIVLLYVLKFIF